MAVRIHRVRVANPARKRRRTRTRNARAGRNRLGRFVKVRAKRKRTVRAGTRRVRVNRRKRVVRRRARAVNPKRRRRVIRRVAVKRTRKVARNRKRKRNSPLLIELGALNPRRERRKRVATKRSTRRSSTTRRRRVNRRRRHINPVGVTRRRRYTRRRRSNARVNHRRRRTNGRRRNPMGMTSGDMLTSVLGGLVGMAATKFLPTLVPASLTAGNAFMSIIVTGVGAFAAGMLADKIAPKYGKAVLVGGLIQTGSTALNTFAPSLAMSLGVSGVGDIIPTQPFPVPNNQMRPVIMLPASNGGGVGNIGAGIKRRAR